MNKSTLKLSGYLWQQSARAWPSAGIRATLLRLRFMAMIIPHIQFVKDWLDQARGSALIVELNNSAQVFRSLSRPYVNNRWSLVERMHSIANHYSVVQTLNQNTLFFPREKYWIPAELDLDDNHIRVMIDRPAWMRTEGEVSVSLFLGIDRIYTIAFSLHEQDGVRTMVIGAIQGANHSNALALYSQLTKVFFGVRPKDLILFVAKIVAKTTGCTTLRAVSDGCHQVIEKKNKDAKVARYDELWLEHGGLLNDSGLYELGIEVRRREAQDIPVKKRSQYRKRYELIDNLEAQISQSFHVDAVQLITHA